MARKRAPSSITSRGQMIQTYTNVPYTYRKKPLDEQLYYLKKNNLDRQIKELKGKNKVALRYAVEFSSANVTFLIIRPGIIIADTEYRMQKKAACNLVYTNGWIIKVYAVVCFYKKTKEDHSYYKKRVNAHKEVVGLSKNTKTELRYAIEFNCGAVFLLGENIDLEEHKQEISMLDMVRGWD